MRYFPVFLDTTDKIIAIIGGGDAAAAKIRLFLSSEAIIYIYAHIVTHDIEMLLHDNPKRITWYKVAPQEHDVRNMLCVYGALDADEQPIINVALLQQWQTMYGFLLSFADNPVFSDFIMPAIVDRDPVIVAISSSGTSPIITQIIKEKIAGIIPYHIGRFANWAHMMRAWVAERCSSARKRRLFWRNFFTLHNPLSPSLAPATILNRDADAYFNTIEHDNQQYSNYLYCYRSNHNIVHDDDIAIFATMDAILLDGKGDLTYMQDYIRKEVITFYDSNLFIQHIKQHDHGIYGVFTDDRALLWPSICSYFERDVTTCIINKPLIASLYDKGVGYESPQYC